MQAERLLECIHSEVRSFTGRVLDLYCGAGTIGLSLASMASGSANVVWPVDAATKRRVMRPMCGTADTLP